MPVGRSFWQLRDWIQARSSSARRAAFIARVRAHAFWQRSEVHLDLAPSVKIGPRVRVSVAARTTNVISLGSFTSIGESTLLDLDGGEVHMGEWVDVRRGVVLTVSGTLSIEGHNLLQPAVYIHCDDRVTLKPMASLGDRATLVDSVHYFSAPEDSFLDNVKTGSIELGLNAWVGVKATIGRNVTVGDYAVVAANSLVLEDVPAGHLAAGVPAKVVRPVRLPWLEGDGASPSPE